MKPRMSVITIGVDDLDRAVAFYRDGLGWKTDGIVGQEYEYGAVAFFELEMGLHLVLWPRTSLSRETGLPVGKPNPNEFWLGHNVNSKEAVDQVMDLAAAAGAHIAKTAEETFWGGYGGFFQDPDGHVWEVVWNPEWTFND